MNKKIKWLVIALGISLGAVSAEKTGIIPEKYTAWVCGLGIVLWLSLTNPKIQKAGLFIFSVLYGVAAVALDGERFQHPAWRMPSKTVILAGEVMTFPEKFGNRWLWEFQIKEFRMEEGEWHKTRGNVEVSVLAQEIPPVIGDRLILKGHIRFPEISEPGGRWTRRRLFLKNLQAQIRVKKFGDIIFVGWNPGTLPLRALQLLRENFSIQIEGDYSLKQSSVLKALLLGMRMPDPELRRIFSRTGTSHLLSVSGFHTAVIAGIVFSGFVLLRFSPRMAAIGAGGGTLMYMALTGWGVAVQRAGLMAILAWTAWVVGRPQTLIYWLNLALAGILWCDPKKIWDISFQLSFLSMYGILLIAPRLKAFSKIPALDVSLAAFLGTYPLILYHFQSFSWAGIFANLLAVPIFAVILPLGFFAFLPGAGVFAAAPLRMLLFAILWVLEKVAQQPWTCWALQQPHPGWIAAYYFLGGMILWLGRPPEESRCLSAS